MSTPAFPRDKTLEVAQACVCLHVQRAARALARHFDEVFRPLGLTNGQFSLLMSLNRPEPPTIGQLAPFLAMDRTTLTALVKPLERRGLIEVLADAGDRRKRRLRLSGEGHALLSRAYPLWCEAHAALDRALGDPATLRSLLMRIAPMPLADRPPPAGPAAKDQAT
ncbi:MarR family winged helix-turn-helix transcriptional regulator [Arenimonas fontis]|uniref:MarR family transcriptional regulator n=1 Tax=Arenimonas fontis TaxID=2608255 RepID=A0A5B2ZG73_9GAMM|nr:MarR family transcriptional regulator [Arenimonas fontis]KAA2286062.1 MarR family transcriptional regulator [Arenimonas fontis]